jgi:hypothetical protein
MDSSDLMLSLLLFESGVSWLGAAAEISLRSMIAARRVCGCGKDRIERSIAKLSWD